MNFKIKCLLQTAFSHSPKGEIINYWFQKYGSKSLPVNDLIFQERLVSANKHLEFFKKYTNQSTLTSNYYEFGAGWDLWSPIYYSSCGFKQLHVIDIRKLIVPELIKHAINKIFPNENFQYTEKLLEELRIFYNAPVDARNTPYEENSMDFIVSNATFEHIPALDILPLLKECHRLLKPNGIFSSLIDYKDHWSYFDKSITPFNYLKYSEKGWKKYNPSLHFQNRLRHKDYINLYKQAGFELLEVHPTVPENGMEILKTINIHPEYEKYTMDELVIGDAFIVARKV